MNFRKRIKSAKRIVIKVGSSMVTYKNGHINLERIDNLSRAISDMVNSGKEGTSFTFLLKWELPKTATPPTNNMKQTNIKINFIFLNNLNKTLPPLILIL